MDGKIVYNTGKVTLTILDEVNCKFEGLNPAVRREMINAVSYMVNGAQHTPSYKLGRWNGKIEFMSMGGSTYIQMLDKLVPILEKYNIHVDVVDQRILHSFEFEDIDKDIFSNVQFPPGHHMQGKSIELREHQVQAVNSLLQNQQGILLACTSAGKAQPLYSKVLTINGWKTMGEISTDDTVICPDGSTARVLGVYPQGIKKTVRITFADGRTVDCCDEHLWYARLEEGNKLLQTKELMEYCGDIYIPSVIPDSSEVEVKISTIEYIPDEECQCIYIDHPEHLYITDDYIVTHNTIITAALSKQIEKYGRTVVIVPSTDLVQQTYNEYVMMGLDTGMFYGEKKEFGHTHTITTWQSFNSLWKQTKKGEIELSEQDIHDFIDGVVCVIGDEAHNCRGEALSAILGKVMNNIPLRFGLTGTLPKDPSHNAKIKSVLGDVVYEITANELQKKGILSTCNINCLRIKSNEKFGTYQEELKYLTTDRDRMKFIADKIKTIAENGNTLVLVDRLECGELLCEYLGIPTKEFVRGQTKKKDREASYGEIRWADNQILIATFGVASTGISISRLYNVVLIEPGKSFIRTIQSIGRGLRKAEDKDHVEIFDISGTNKFSSRHHRERIQYYKEVQYPYTETKLDME